MGGERVSVLVLQHLLVNAGFELACFPIPDSHFLFSDSWLWKNHFKSFAENRHRIIRGLSYGFTFLRKEFPMNFSPIGQCAITFTFFIGLPFINRVKWPYLDLCGFDNTKGLPALSKIMLKTPIRG